MRLLVLFLLLGCTDPYRVIPSKEHEGYWICDSMKEGMFYFSGDNAEARAHERCDSFQLPFHKLNQEQK